jgi:hypothetical protein
MKLMLAQRQKVSALQHSRLLNPQQQMALAAHRSIEKQSKNITARSLMRVTAFPSISSKDVMPRTGAPHTCVI